MACGVVAGAELREEFVVDHGSRFHGRVDFAKISFVSGGGVETQPAGGGLARVAESVWGAADGGEQVTGTGRHFAVAVVQGDFTFQAVEVLVVAVVDMWFRADDPGCEGELLEAEAFRAFSMTCPPGRRPVPTIIRYCRPVGGW